MTTNGMKESEDKIARIPEVDVGTFLRFRDYAYSGSYHSDTVSRSDMLACAFDQPNHGLKTYHCRLCQTKITTPSSISNDEFPFCRRAHRNEGMMFPTNSYCAKCGRDVSSDAFYNNSTSNVCSGCETELKSILVTVDGDLSSFQSGLFRKLKILEGDSSNATLPPHREQAARGTSDSGSCSAISSHVRLHIFADMQMIPQLKQMSLFRLHRDLCNLGISEGSVADIINLVIYTYENTTKEDSREVEPENSLRALVALYTTEHIRLLMKYAAFRDLMKGGGEFVEDTIQGLVDRSTACQCDAY